MPDYSVDQELVQFGEGSLTFLEPRLGRERRVEAQGEMIHFPESCVPRDYLRLQTNGITTIRPATTLQKPDSSDAWPMSNLRPSCENSTSSPVTD